VLVAVDQGCCCALGAKGKGEGWGARQAVVGPSGVMALVAVHSG